MGTGVTRGDISINGTIKPGYSPGYLAANSSVTSNSGSIYQEDIAGKIQASATSLVGATGYYSYLKVGGQRVINSGSTLALMLQNLFSPSEAGYESAVFVPRVGDLFRIITAAGGITGIPSAPRLAIIISGVTWLIRKAIAAVTVILVAGTAICISWCLVRIFTQPMA